MNDQRWIPYNFAFLRVVPHVYLGAFVNVGIVFHARTENFLGVRTLSDPESLRGRIDGVDHELLARYLKLCEAICAGDPDAGPVALAPSSERFHWLTAPRSDVLQPSPVHVGLCLDPEAELDRLFRACFGGSGSPAPASDCWP